MSADNRCSVGKFLAEIRAEPNTSAISELDVALLIEKVTGWTRLDQIAYPEREIQSEAVGQLRELIRLRKSGTPLAYLTGNREFWGLDFKVSEAVLIPRPETELIVELCVKFLMQTSEPTLGLDCGTGSGCIAISILHETKRRQTVRMLALDLSQAALVLARKNAEVHQVLNQVSFLRSNWCEALSEKSRFDFIVSNPPYIADGDPNVSEDTHAEPRHALYSGARGTEALELLFAQCEKRLKVGGAAFLECGAMQGEELLRYARTFSTLRATVHKDLAGLDRVVEIRKIR